ncbi:MAG TPA: hypothetical protein VFA32_01140, partial [Dehalococcoidia bacterium]|nr:hypothetical protein [Dehalococcoidia bacterium]
GAEVDSEILKKQWEQTQKHLASFSGRTKDIQGRPYLHFHDFIRWPGRKAKGALGSGLRAGLVLSNWNRRVAAKGGDGTATLESVKVSQLSSYLEGYRYHLCQDSEEVAEEKRRRESLLEALRGWKPDSLSDERY